VDSHLSVNPLNSILSLSHRNGIIEIVMGQGKGLLLLVFGGSDGQNETQPAGIPNGFSKTHLGVICYMFCSIAGVVGRGNGRYW
jgi:hypothetical protein